LSRSVNHCGNIRCRAILIELSQRARRPFSAFPHWLCANPLALYKWVSFAAAFALLASPATAQTTAASETIRRPARNTISEAAADLWFPTADISVASESLGIVGSNIDFKRALA